MGYARYLDSRLKNSDPAAHAAGRLVLLGSPPDTVHGAALRGTGLSSLLIQGRQHITRPGAGIHPRFSGLRVQGTAISPTSAALLHAETGTELNCIVLYFCRFSNDNFSIPPQRIKFPAVPSKIIRYSQPDVPAPEPLQFAFQA